MLPHLPLRQCRCLLLFDLSLILPPSGRLRSHGAHRDVSIGPIKNAPEGTRPDTYEQARLVPFSNRLARPELPVAAFPRADQIRSLFSWLRRVGFIDQLVGAV